jgi:predicted nucleotidyltransferase
MALHRDFVELLTEFADAGVRYLIVGGYAVGFHSRPRATKDLDLWIEGTRENLNRVAKALDCFGAPPEIIEAVPSLREDEILYFGRPPLRVDLLRSIPACSFDTAWERRVDTRWEGVAVHVIGLEDLVESKRRTGRSQDRIDVRSLSRPRRPRPRGGRPRRSGRG